MDERVEQGLERSQVVDITTKGRRSGIPRRIEIYLHRIGDRLYISGRPSLRKRGWIWNLEADPHMTLHLKGSVRADLPATGRVIDGEAERREVIARVAEAWHRSDVDTMVAHSPLIEVTPEPSEVPAAT